MAAQTIHERIESVLLSRYTEEHLVVFARQAGATSTKDVEAELGVALPASLHAFYAWAQDAVRSRGASFEVPEGGIAVLDDGAYRICPAERILASTRTWQKLQAEKPEREWKPGFVHLMTFSSAYELVLDTAGEVVEPANQLVHWDFKGGSFYRRRYSDYESYLEEILGLLEADRYFDPPEDAPDHDSRLDAMYDGWGDLISDMEKVESVPF